MTCHEARDLYSGLLDDALDPGERAALTAHVAGCAECARELERVRRTVSLLRAAEPVRAPAGFVDRVLVAARPTPWYRRLAQQLFWPLRVKLPLEAAAVLLVAGAAVYVFQHTPELQQAARQETAQETPPKSPAPAPSTGYPAPPPVSAPSVPFSAQAPEVSTRPAPQADKRSAPTELAPPVGAKPSETPAVSSEPTGADAKGADAGTAATKSSAPSLERRAKEAAGRTEPETTGSGARAGGTAEPFVADQARRNAQAPSNQASRDQPASDLAARDRVLPPVLPDTPAPAQPGAPAREEKVTAPATAPPPAPADAADALKKSAPAESPPASPGAISGTTPGAAGVRPGDGRLQSAPRARQDTFSRIAAPPSADVAARLAVADLEIAFRGLADLLARAGGRELSRRPDGDTTAIEVVVPRERYAEFVRSLAQLGRLRLEGEPATLPALVRLALRIGA